MESTMPDIEFEKLRGDFESFYKSIEKVHCPYLSEDVHFNAMGLEHLKFGRKNHARVRDEQAVRMKLFPFAKEILHLSKTVQGITHVNKFETLRFNQRTDTRMVPVSYFEFVAILKEKRVRVVVKQINGGPKFFWSIIPFWKVDRVTGRRRMSYGDPETA